jgi:Transglutaminase-like superfamily
MRSSSRRSLAIARRQPDSRPAVSLLGVVAVAVAAPFLARLDLHRLQCCLEPRSSRSPSADPDQVVEVLGRRVNQVIRWGRPLVRPGCLTRGITGYYLLRRAGLDVALCFGMGPVRGPGAAGHCWLVLNGEPVLEPADPRPAFTELVRLSSRGLISAGAAP